jgi:hypothetical protein
VRPRVRTGAKALRIPQRRFDQEKERSIGF